MADRMRVIQLGPFPPPNGGVQTNLKAIHDMLLERGHEPSVIALTRASQVNGISNAYKPRSAFQLLKLLLTVRADIVHFHVGGDFTTRLAVLMLVCGLLPGRKSVVTFHSGGYARDAAATARRVSLRGFAFRSADHVIGVNSQMLKMFRSFGVAEDRMSLILPFVLEKPGSDTVVPEHLAAFAEKYDPLILSVSGLEPEYNVALQIDAMPSIVDRFPRAGLMILGSGSIENEIREHIDRQKDAANICLAGDVEHAAALKLIERADVMMRPTRYDGDAICIREALFLKTPVVATDNGMRPDGTHLISSKPDANELAAKVIEVLGNGNKTAESNIVNGRKNIEDVIGLYKQLLAE